MRKAILTSTLLILLAGACGGATTSAGDTAGGGGTSGSGAGGGSGPGGGSGGGDGTPDAGPVVCNAGSVTFEFTSAGAPAITYCVGMDCSAQWLTIKDATGQVVQLAHDCMSYCATCQQGGCALLCALPQVMKPDGERQVWDGTFFTEGTCGQGNSCANPNCAAPGKYVATMCAGVKNNPDPMFCETDANQQCVDVEFVYPSPAVVKGTVGPIR